MDQTCMSLLVSSCECPLCKQILKPPIKMCLNGHCVCVSCVLVASNCPLCRASFSCSKLRIFEQVLNIVSCACIHAKFGCSMFLDSTNKVNHEAYCGWRQVNCLWCVWRGSVNKWAEHVVEQHGPHALLYETDGIKTIPLGRDVDKTLFYINGVLFCLFGAKDRNGPLFLTIQCFPTVKEDMKTVFTISIENNELHFSQSIHPVSDKVERTNIFQNLDNCIILPNYLIRGKDSFFFSLKMGDKV